MTPSTYGGGLDLRFPHHENEQAQSRAAGYDFAQLWMHSAWVTQSGAKMSKVPRQRPFGLRRCLSAIPHPRCGSRSRRFTIDRCSSFPMRRWMTRSPPGRASPGSSRARLSVSERRRSTTSRTRPCQRRSSRRWMTTSRCHVPSRSSTTRCARVMRCARPPATHRLSRRHFEVRAMLSVLGLDPASPEWAGTDSAASGAMAALDTLVQADSRGSGTGPRHEGLGGGRRDPRPAGRGGHCARGLE